MQYRTVLIRAVLIALPISAGRLPDKQNQQPQLGSLFPKGLFIHLEIRIRKKRERERFFVCWLTPQMAAMASVEQGAPTESSTREVAAQTPGPSSAAFHRSLTGIWITMDHKWSSWDMDQCLKQIRVALPTTHLSSTPAFTQAIPSKNLLDLE